MAVVKAFFRNFDNMAKSEFVIFSVFFVDILYQGLYLAVCIVEKIEISVVGRAITFFESLCLRAGFFGQLKRWSRKNQLVVGSDC